MYEYRVIKILRVIDGDTVDAKISLGFGLSANFRFRLQGVDTPEIYGPNASEEGKAAKAFVEQWFEDHSSDAIVVRTYKASDASVGIGDGAFGRWLGNFCALGLYPDSYDDLTLDLISEGFSK